MPIILSKQFFFPSTPKAKCSGFESCNWFLSWSSLPCFYPTLRFQQTAFFLKEKKFQWGCFFSFTPSSMDNSRPMVSCPKNVPGLVSVSHTMAQQTPRKACQLNNVWNTRSKGGGGSQFKLIIVCSGTWSTEFIVCVCSKKSMLPQAAGKQLPI